MNANCRNVFGNILQLELPIFLDKKCLSIQGLQIDCGYCSHQGKPSLHWQLFSCSPILQSMNKLRVEWTQSGSLFTNIPKMHLLWFLVFPLRNSFYLLWRTQSLKRKRGVYCLIVVSVCLSFCLWRKQKKALCGWSMTQTGARGEKISSGQVNLDGQMDGRTDHYKVHA